VATAGAIALTMVALSYTLAHWFVKPNRNRATAALEPTPRI
jgi:hypothetical protein